MDAPTPRSISLRTQLVGHALLSVCIPLVLAGGLAFSFFSYHLDIVETSYTGERESLSNNTVASTDLVVHASDAARQIDGFMIDRIGEAKAWASASVVVNAARSAHETHAAEGLMDASVDDIETRFRIEKSLNTSPEADAYLRGQVLSSPYFAEIFFTDRNGFNVALTNPTSDFVQSDEDWWQGAWGSGMSIGEVSYDESADVWSIDIAIRIEDSTAKEPVGVMKTVLAIEPIQRIADWTAQAIPQGRAQIATANGALIAETSSGHARERIMSPAVNVRMENGETVRAAFGPERTGVESDQEWLTAHARTGGPDTYAATARQFAGFDWIVILQEPLAGILEPMAALRSIKEALYDWRWIFLAALAGLAVLGTILAVALAAAIAHRYAASLHAIQDMAERTARGERVIPDPIGHPTEIAQVSNAVHGLNQAFMSVLEKGRSRR